MTSNSKKEQFALDLLDALRHGVFTRNPKASERINDFAEIVKRRLDKLIAVLDDRSLQCYPKAIETARDLKSRLEKAMSARLAAQVGGVVGNACRIGGGLGYAFPVGRVVFWTGLVVTSLSDMLSCQKRKEIGDISSQIRRVLETDREDFRAGAVAIRNLEATIEAETGWSLYDEEFREFLRNAAEAPAERVEDLVACNQTIENPEHRTNLIDIGRNRDLIRTLTYIVDGVQRKDIVLLNFVMAGLCACSSVESSPVTSAAFQVGELAVRGLTLFLEYEQDLLALKEFEVGIARMNKELTALRKVFPDM